MLASKTLTLSSLTPAIHGTRNQPPSPLLLLLLHPRPSSPLGFLRLGSHASNKPLFARHASVPAMDPPSGAPSDDTVEELLTKGDRIERLMKMERRADPPPLAEEVLGQRQRRRWFPYVDVFRSGTVEVSSSEVVDALDPYITDARKERIRRAVASRSYSVCLVVEGLTDFGNVSAAFRSADALGVQSVHVISCDGSKRYRDNRHVSMGAEKWLDIELWNSPSECFRALKKRGYRVATARLGTDSASVYELDWSVPTAIVVGNEHMGISEEALTLSDLHCMLPMKGMVDSFNVSVAAGILMHHAVCDRVSRLGHHGDLMPEESEILLAEFYLRHRESTVSIVHEYAKRKAENSLPNYRIKLLNAAA